MGNTNLQFETKTRSRRSSIYFKDLVDMPRSLGAKIDALRHLMRQNLKLAPQCETTANAVSQINYK